MKIRYFLDACAREGFTPRIEFAEMRSSTVFSRAAAGLVVVPMMYCPRLVYPGVAVLPDRGRHYRFLRVCFYKKTDHPPALRAFLSYLRSTLPAADDE